VTLSRSTDGQVFLIDSLGNRFRADVLSSRTFGVTVGVSNYTEIVFVAAGEILARAAVPPLHSCG